MTDRDSLLRVARQPSALAPLAVAVAALSLVLGHAAIYGTAHQPDEGAAAHLWQLLIALEIPLAVFFVLRWVRRATRAALLLLGALMVALIANFAAVYLLT